MNKSKELYNDYVVKVKKWNKMFDAEPRVPKSATTSRAKDRFFASKKYQTWLAKEEALNREVRDADNKLYNHLTKSGLKMKKYEYWRMMANAVHGRGNVGEQLKAKAKIKLILNTVGRNEPKTNAKYKLPSQSQLSRGCGRR